MFTHAQKHNMNNFHLLKVSFWKRKCLLACVESYRKTMITDKTELEEEILLVEHTVINEQLKHMDINNY